VSTALSILLTAGLALSPAAAQKKRIVSTTPAITEMLFAIGLGPRVVGVTSYCRYPPEAAKLPKVGGFINPDLEAIVALKPDLVAIQKNPVQLAEKIGRLGLHVVEVRHDTIHDALGAIEELGRAAGAPNESLRLTAKLRADLETIRRATSGSPRRTMAFFVGRNPGQVEGLVAVGRRTYLQDLIVIAGGTNVFEDAIAPYPKVNLEEVLARNPEVIIDMGDMSQTRDFTEAHKQAIVALWGKFPALRAVRERKVFPVADDIYVVPGPRMIDAARSFARILHPEAFR